MIDCLDFFAKTSKRQNRPPEIQIPGVESLQDLAQILYDRFGGKRIVIKAYVDDTGPSDSDRKYFHAVVKKYCRQGFREVGYMYSDAETYAALKRQYLKVPEGELEPSLSAYSEEQYRDFAEWCIWFAAENLGVEVPAKVPRDSGFPTEER